MSTLPSDAASTAPDRTAAQKIRDRDDVIFTRFDSRVVRRLMAFVRPHRRTLIAALISVGLFTIVQVSIPVTVRYAIDSAVGNTPLRLDTVLLCFAVLIVLNAVLNFLQEWIA